MSVSVAVCDEPFAVAVMVIIVIAVTACVVISNDACMAPLGNASVAGTCAMDGLLLDSVTTTLAAATGISSVTVPTTGLPLVAVLGANVSD